MWDTFCQEYFGHGDLIGKDIEDLPDDFPPLKYNVVEVWYKIGEDLELYGPYLTKEAARKSD